MAASEAINGRNGNQGLHFDAHLPSILIADDSHDSANTLGCLSPELRAEVRHIRKCDEEDYLVGCRFSRPLQMEDMMALEIGC